MQRIVCAILLLLLYVSSTAQKTPLYWKQRAPYQSYWQQDVAYYMEVSLNDSLDRIESTVYKLEYTNNSPDDLHELYFHLFSNAFQPGSYYDQLWKGNQMKPTFGPKEQEGLGTVVENVQVQGRSVETLLDNTILQVKLSSPIRSGETAVITMDFQTYFDNKGSMRRRMKMLEDGFGNKHYDAVHWYPSIACYDRKFGWTTDQHLDKEFYHDFGSFEVKITLPQEYIVDGTGMLLNEATVLPDSLMARLKIENFKDKPFGEAPSIIIPKGTGKTKTWHFYADLVHNFVFTTDPTYRIGIDRVKLPGISGNGIVVHALAQEPHAAKWQQTAAFCRKIIEEYSLQFGYYAWPKIIAADADDGMEYPMITIAGGTYPGHQSLLAHEIGHMWYYGMVGNNETYRAMMDEGFTQFLTVWFMDKMTGQNDKKNQSKDLDMPANRYWRLYYPYLSNTWDGFDHPLNTHSSGFHSGIRHGGGYGLVYYKTGVMLYNLMYVLGEETFMEAMQYYFEKWKFCHPYPEDFRQAIIEYTHADLNWFFDQWMETTKNIDYAVTGLKKGTGEHEYTVKLARKGRMQMPIDLLVITKSGDSSYYHIPNTWYIKHTDATILPKWYGWDLLNPTYEATITTTDEIENIIIDPEHLMADVDLRNNQWKSAQKVEISTIRKSNTTYWNGSYTNLSTVAWYNRYDGIQLGIQRSGNYFGKDNFYDAKLYFNTRIGQDAAHIDDLGKNDNVPVSFFFTSQQRLKRVSRETFASEWYQMNAGILNGGVQLDKTFRHQDQRNPAYRKIFISTKYLVNSNNRNHQQEYLLYPTQWSTGTSVINGSTWAADRINASVNMGLEEQYKYGMGLGKYQISLRVPGLFGDYLYSYVQLENINSLRPWKKMDIKTRVFGRIGTGAPLESALYLAGANPEEMLNNDFTRADAFFPTSWSGYGNSTNHLQLGGGMNLRGYAGYLAAETKEGEIYFTHVGNSGASASAEIDFDSYLPVRMKKWSKWMHLDTYIFADAGIMAYQDIVGQSQLGSFRADAGLGTALTLKKLPLNVYKPITIRFDMPLYLNRAPYAESNNVQSRYVVGIGRSF